MLTIGENQVLGNRDGSILHKMNTNKTKLLYGLIGLLGVITVALAIALVVLVTRPAKVVSNFDQCKAAGGAIMESFPEQCSINGMSFTDTAKTSPEDSYIGLSEADALAKAEQAHIPARVVERDGKSSAVTMDFIFGRYNLYIKDGKVSHVEVEGKATDINQQ